MAKFVLALQSAVESRKVSGDVSHPLLTVKLRQNHFPFAKSLDFWDKIVEPFLFLGKGCEACCKLQPLQQRRS